VQHGAAVQSDDTNTLTVVSAAELTPVYAVWLSITNYNANYKQQRHTTASDTLFTRYSTAILHPYLINWVTLNHHFLLLFPSYLSNRPECDITHKRLCIFVYRNDGNPRVTPLTNDVS